MGPVAWLRQLDDRVLGPGGPPPEGHRLEEVTGPAWLKMPGLVVGLVAGLLLVLQGPGLALLVIAPSGLVQLFLMVRHERRVRLAWQQEREGP